MLRTEFSIQFTRI